jgi:hypothetical protein
LNSQLSAAIFSGDYLERRSAGEVFLAMLDPGQMLMRRVETIRPQSTSITDRSSSVDLDLAPVLKSARDRSLSVDLVILGVLPKEIAYEFDARDASGAALSIVSRETNSRIAQCLLVVRALEANPSLQIPSQTVWTQLWKHVYRFPQAPPSKGTISARAHAAGIGLTGAAKDWWESASDNEEWRHWVVKFETQFLLVGKFIEPSRSLVVKYRRLESNLPTGPGVGYLVDAPANPAKSFSIRLYDIGRARSEHVRVKAARDTFIADGTLHRSGRNQIDYRHRAARHTLAFYTTNAPGGTKGQPGDCVILATVWPDPRGFVIPLRLLSWYAAIALAVAFMLQITGLISQISTALDAFLAFALFTPALVLGFLFRFDEQEIRWDLLRPWRRLASQAGVPLWLGIALLFINPSSRAGVISVAVCFAAIFVVSVTTLIRVELLVKKVRKASEKVRRQETRPPKGIRVTKK